MVIAIAVPLYADSADIVQPITAPSTKIADLFCANVLGELGARPTKCPHEYDESYTIHYCGVARYDAQTVKYKVNDLLSSMAASGAVNAEWTWSRLAREPSLRVNVDGHRIYIGYDESTGYVDLFFDKPLPECAVRPQESLIPVSVVLTPGRYYPELARVARLEGRVEVEVDVGVDEQDRLVCLRSSTRPHVGFEQVTFMFVLEKWVELRDAGSYRVDISFALESETKEDGVEGRASPAWRDVTTSAESTP